MEFTQEKIDSLIVNEVDIMKKIADELNYERTTVSKKLDKYTKNIE